MLLGFVELIVGSLFALVAAAALLHRLRSGSRSVDALTLLVLWNVVATLSVWSLGVCGLLNGHLASVLALLGLVGLRFERNGMALLRRAALCCATSLRRALEQHPGWAILYISATVFLLARMLVHTWLLAPYVYDVLTYHLPKVGDWIQAGRLVALDTPVLRSFWPAGFELLQAWPCLFLHHDALVELAGLPFYALGAGAVIVIGRSLGLQYVGAVGAALCYAFTPAFLQNAVSCKNDVAVCGLFLYGMALLCDYRRRGGNPAVCGSLLLISVILGVGIKPTMLLLTPALALMAGLALYAQRQVTPSLKPLKLSHVLLVLSVSACSAFWYVRNWALFGNPLYPVPSRLLGASAWVAGDAGSQQGGFSFAALGTNVSNLIGTRIFDVKGPFNPELGNLSGWGWFVLACGVPAALLAIVRWGAYRRFALCMIVAGICLLGSVSPDPWNMRFMYWFPAFFAIGFAGTLRYVSIRPVRDALVALAIACCVLNAIGTLDTGYYEVDQWRGRMQTPLAQRAVWAGQDPALALVPPGQTLGYSLHGNHWIYPLYRPDLSQGIVHVDPMRGESFAHAMSRQGLSFIFIPPGATRYEAFVVEAAAHGRFKDLGSNVYRLKSPSRGGPDAQ